MLGKRKLQKRAPKQRPTRLAQRRKTMRLILTALTIALLLLLCAAVAWLSYQPRLNIQQVIVTGTDELSARVLAQFVESKLYDGTLHVLSPRNELLVHRHELADVLLAQYPRLKSVEVPFSNFTQTLTVQVSEREAQYLWCAAQKLERCYLADNDGYIFAYDDSHTYDLRIVRSTLDTDEPIRAHIATKNVFESLKIFFVRLSDSLGMDVREARLEDSDAYLYPTSTEPYIKVDLKGDVVKQISNLQAILQSQEYTQNKASDYIDLRFGHRVYYK